MTVSVKVKRVKVVETLTRLIKEETDTQKRIQAEVKAYEKAYTEWSAKATKWVIKNHPDLFRVSYYRSDRAITITTDDIPMHLVRAGIGEDPKRSESHHVTRYNLSELTNAKALYEMSTEEVVTISSKNSWASALQ